MQPWKEHSGPLLQDHTSLRHAHTTALHNNAETPLQGGSCAISQVSPCNISPRVQDKGNYFCPAGPDNGARTQAATSAGQAGESCVGSGSISTTNNEPFTIRRNCTGIKSHLTLTCRSAQVNVTEHTGDDISFVFNHHDSVRRARS